MTKFHRKWREVSEQQVHNLRAFRSSPLGLPVIVARAELLVPVCSWRYAQAFGATLLAEEHAWLFVCRL